MTNLDELPAEVLHRISEYLPAKDAWSNLRPVSKKTDQKLSAVSYWANQIQKRYKINLPPRLLPSTPVAAAKRCSSVETSFRRWQWTQGRDEKVIKVRDREIYNGGMLKLHHTSAGKRFCFTAADHADRGSSIVMWNYEQQVYGASSVCKVIKAHDESLDSLATWGDDTIYSTDWQNLKFWKIVEGAIQLVDKLHVPSAQGLRCVPDGENVVYCAISEPLEDPYEKGVALFDTRAGLQWPPLVLMDPFYSQVISGLATHHDSNYVYTMSFGGRLVMMDKRMLQAVVNSMELPHEAPQYLTLSDGTLAAGQWEVVEWLAEEECAVLINPVDLSIEKEIRQFPEPTESWLSGNWENHVQAKVTEGATVVTARDTLNIFTPGTDPKLLHSIQVDSPIWNMDCLGGDSAVGMLDGTVAIWPIGTRNML